MKNKNETIGSMIKQMDETICKFNKICCNLENYDKEKAELNKEFSEYFIKLSNLSDKYSLSKTIDEKHNLNQKIKSIEESVFQSVVCNLLEKHYRLDDDESEAMEECLTKKNIALYASTEYAKFLNYIITKDKYIVNEDCPHGMPYTLLEMPRDFKLLINIYENY